VTNAPNPYRVAYSERVRNALRDLIARARQRGLGRQDLDAIKEIDYRLRIYPQFGEPLLDLAYEPGHIWIGTVRPLVVRYAVLEQRRLVTVSVPIRALPGFGF
jgi:hypothetical protein